ncbi:MAG TPA: DUF3089 domain-containing protein [Caulobacteraceae bacterium]|nr:DUF3089 domain-containing protein [Caulobacteraceae bacterium]
MAERRRGIRYWLALVAGVLVTLGVVASVVWDDDIIKFLLDPKVPFSKDRRPTEPDYAQRASWALLPDPGAAPGETDIFFVHPTSYPASFTSYNGGRHWNAPINDRAAAVTLAQVMLPNYAGPFDAVGDVYAPRYRQASLYTKATLWDDAIEAREFAYGDVKAAFEYYMARYNRGRPFFLAGAEQGGDLAARLLREVIAPSAQFRSQLVGAYLVDTAAPADEYGPTAPVPACQRRAEAGCLVAWVAVRQGDFTGVQRLLGRAMVWGPQQQLQPLGPRRPLCVNPLLGSTSEAVAPERLNLGAAAAVGLEWGVRPGFMVRQVGAHCEGGVLRVSRPRSSLLRPSGDWIERAREPGYNLFWADIEADTQARYAVWAAAHPASAPAPGLQSKSS